MPNKVRTAGLAALMLAMTTLPTAASATAGAEGQPGCEAQVESASHAFDEAFIERDFEGFMAFVADDAMQIDYLGHVFLGKEAIAAFTRAVMANDYEFTHTLIDQTLRPCTSASVLQDTVFTIPGRLTLHLLDAVNWARLQGEWKVVMIQNTELPA